jgi:hypothetical protein
MHMWDTLSRGRPVLACHNLHLAQKTPLLTWIDTVRPSALYAFSTAPPTLCTARNRSPISSLLSSVIRATTRRGKTRTSMRLSGWTTLGNRE